MKTLPALFLAAFTLALPLFAQDAPPKYGPPSSDAIYLKDLRAKVLDYEGKVIEIRCFSRSPIHQVDESSYYCWIRDDGGVSALVQFPKAAYTWFNDMSMRTGSGHRYVFYATVAPGQVHALSGTLASDALLTAIGRNYTHDSGEEEGHYEW